jgi:hypothetical protein
MCNTQPQDCSEQDVKLCAGNRSVMLICRKIFLAKVGTLGPPTPYLHLHTIENIS